MSAYKWKYVGDEAAVTPCEYHNSPEATYEECYDGQCPGRVYDGCPFLRGSVRYGYRSAFVITDMDGNPIKKRWQFIGSPDRVTPCPERERWEFPDNVDNGRACVDGSCPGEIDGKCMFSCGRPMDKYREEFVRLDE